MIYSWKNKGFFHTDAQVAGEVCEELNKTVGATAENLLDVSRPDDAPLHNEFEWDDSVAAEGYRKYQAGNIIRNLVIVHEDCTQPTRAFVSIEQRVAHPVLYEPIIEVMTDEEKRKRLLSQARIELNVFKAKYSGLKELAKVFKAIDQLEEGER